MPNEMEYTFYLGLLVYQSNETEVLSEDLTKQLVPVQTSNSNVENQGSHHHEIPKVFAKLLRLIEFDTFVATHGPGTDVDGEYNFSLSPNPDYIVTFFQMFLPTNVNQTAN